MRDFFFRIRRFVFRKFSSDKFYTLWLFKQAFGYEFDVENPKTLNEKIQWLKLNERNPLYTEYADKVKVRDHVANVIGDQVLVPLVGVYESVDEFTIDELPEFPIIIKTNHDSGSTYIIKDKTAINLQKIKSSLRRSLSRNYYNQTKEWQYKNIPPRILIEKLLVGVDGKLPFDYKFHCLNGSVRMIQVDMDRGTPMHSRNWYDRNWEREKFKWTAICDGVVTNPSHNDVAKPKELKKLITYSELLSKPFPLARIDWYILDEVVYFGEVTFHQDSGFRPIEPEEWDLKLGSELNLKKQ